MKYRQENKNITILARPWAVEKPYFCENDKKLVIGKLLIKFDDDDQNYECNISKEEYFEMIEHDDYKPLRSYTNFGIPLDLLMLTPEEWEKTVEGQED